MFLGKKKKVTTNQTDQVCKMANEKGINREVFQNELLDNGLMSRILDAVKDDVLITIGIPFGPPPGGRLHFIKVKVQFNQEWQAAVNAAGPNTPDNYNVRKVGDLYQPTGTGVVEEELILLNYPKGDGNWNKALAWAEQFQLRRTDPRRVFAVGECHPNFNQDVGINPTYVVATEDCSFDGDRRACFVWWGDSKRKADLFWVSYYGYAHDWFAFRR
jgi:hypothetical protein